MSNQMQRLGTLQGRTLFTVSGKPFLITSVAHDYIRVMPESSGKERTIRRAEIEGALALVAKGIEVTPLRVRESGASEYNPAYVAAIVLVLIGA